MSSPVRSAPIPATRLVVVVAALCAAGAARATEVESTGDARAALLERLEAAEQRIKVLERRLELQTEEAARVAADAPVVRADARGFSLSSKDGASTLRLRAVLNVDGRVYEGSPPAFGSETWLLRQARLIFEGTTGGIFDYRLMADFASGRSVIQDGYLTARLRPYATLTAGKFKVPFGLERLQSDTDIRFVERGLPNNLVPNRDVGVQFAGEVLDGRVQYQLAAQNGAIDGGSSDGIGDVDNDGRQEFAGRLFLQPFLQSDTFALRGVGVGVAAGYADTEGAPGRTMLPVYRSNGQLPIFTYRVGTTPTVASGERIRLSPQAYWYTGSLGLLGEYVQVRQDVARALSAATVRRDRLEHDAWQLVASWYLTGEDAGYRAAAPKAPFAKGGGWGALELVARYGVLDLDARTFAGGSASFADPALSVRRATALGIGANWYLTRSIKTVLNYEWTRFDGGAAGRDRPDERAWFSRFQLGF